MKIKRTFDTFLIIPTIFFLYYIFLGVNLPYVGPNAANFSVYSLIAHNFNYFGYIPTKLAPIYSVSQTFPVKPDYFFHHPTLLSFVESLLFKVFGEGFWVGRLSVIIFALGSFILLYLIAKKIGNKNYARISLAIASLIPATTIFGKMIGQEPLVLFFGLLAVYAILEYLSTGRRIFVFLCSLAIVLGILSDWPMGFFIVCFLPLLIKHKKIKTGMLFVALSIGVVGLLFLSISFIMSGLWDLQNALALRSVNGLSGIPYWPLKWITVMFFRLAVYFNPIFLIFSLASLYGIYKQFKKRKLSDRDLVIVGFCLFSVMHVLIYAQAAFTHPYLLYYWLPFVTLGSSLIIMKLLKKKISFLLLIILFSLIYLVTIQKFKYEQTIANVWRYDLIYATSTYFSPYEEVLLDNGLIINTDILWYPFLLNWKIDPGNDTMHLIKGYKHYVYSCQKVCMPQDTRLNNLKHTYNFVHIIHPEAEAYVFFSQQKKESHENRELRISSKEGQGEINSQLLSLYRFLRDKLSLSQF